MTPTPSAAMSAALKTPVVKPKKPGKAKTLRPSVVETMGPLIHALNPHDVMLGRGAPTAYYEGNVKFRTIVNHFKPEYMAGGRHDAKQAIAQRVLDEVHTRGGRFLSEVPNAAATPITAGGSTTPKTWREASHTVALEKVKQALRSKTAADDVPLAAVHSDPTGVLKSTVEVSEPARTLGILPTNIASTSVFPNEPQSKSTDKDTSDQGATLPTPNNTEAPSVASVMPTDTATLPGAPATSAAAPVAFMALPSTLAPVSGTVAAPVATAPSAGAAPDSTVSNTTPLLAGQLLAQCQMTQQPHVNQLAALVQQQQLQQQQLQDWLYPQQPLLGWTGDAATSTTPILVSSLGATNAAHSLPSLPAASTVQIPASHWLSNLASFPLGTTTLPVTAGAAASNPLLGNGLDVGHILGAYLLQQQPQQQPQPMDAAALLGSWNAALAHSTASATTDPTATAVAFLAATSTDAPAASNASQGSS